MKQRPKHIFEFVALRVLAGVVRCVPYRAALFVGWLNAVFSFYIMRFRVREAKDRIRQVMGDSLSDRQVTRIAWHSWRNIVFSGIEMLRLDKITTQTSADLLDAAEVFGPMKAHTDTGQGAIAAVAHMGSWELAGVTAHLLGIPVFTFVANQKNPLVNDYLNQLRQSPGIEILSRDDASIRPIIRNLKAGKLLAILPDVRMRSGGIKVPFFGGEANVGKGMATFARQCNVPIFPCTFARHGWAHHKGVMSEPIWPNPELDKETDIRRMTEQVLTLIEHAVRQDPGQWFWFNKRWILDP